MEKVSKKEFLLNGLIVSNCEILEDSNKHKLLILCEWVIKQLLELVVKNRF